jgi:glycine/D-amino acid oxidase-like deaminating enzyme
MSLVELPDRADVVVVGGGIMGTSTTYFLAATTDLDVVLVEQDQIAGGSTGDSSAILRHHYGTDGIVDVETYSRMAWWSHQFYREFDQELGEELAYGRSPLVGFADEETGEGVLEGYRVLQELEIPATRHDGQELDEEYPMIETEPYDFAVSDDTAAYSDGTDAASGFARAAQEQGATVVTGVAVEEAVTADGAVTGVETDSGTVDCDSLVVTAGPWTPRFVEQFGVHVPIVPTREQVFILEPPPEFAADHPDLVPTSGADDGWYIRPDFGGGVLLATHHTGSEVDPDHYSDTPDQEVLLELVDELEAFVPGLADAEVKGQYCGVYSDTPDHDFIIDQVGPDGCWIGCGFSGHGFKHGPAVGRILRDLVLEGETDFVDIDYFSFDRFDEHPDGHGAGRTDN